MSVTDAFNVALPEPAKVYYEYNGRTSEIGALREDPARNTLTFEPFTGADLGLCAIFAAQCANERPDKTVRLSFHEKIHEVPRGTDGLALAASIVGHEVHPLRGSLTLKARIPPETIRDAIIGDDLGALRTALQYEAWPDAGFQDGYPGISIAAAKGREGRAFVKLLLEHDASVNKIAEDGVTPLMMAARGGDIEIAKMLLDAGAWHWPSDAEGKHALDHASNAEMKNFLAGPYPVEAEARLKQEAEAALVKNATILQRSVAPMAPLSFKKS